MTPTAGPVRARCTDNRYCPDRGLIVVIPDPARRRCRVCGWLMRHLEQEARAAPAAEGAPGGAA